MWCKQAGFFCHFLACLRDMMGVRVVIEVAVGVVRVICGVRMSVGVSSVGNRGEGVADSGAGGGGTVAIPRWDFQSFGKTAHIISHSGSIFVMSFCRLACKEEVVKVVETLID